MATKKRTVPVAKEAWKPKTPVRRAYRGESVKSRPARTRGTNPKGWKPKEDKGTNVKMLGNPGVGRTSSLNIDDKAPRLSVWDSVAGGYKVIVLNQEDTSTVLKHLLEDNKILSAKPLNQETKSVVANGKSDTRALADELIRQRANAERLADVLVGISFLTARMNGEKNAEMQSIIEVNDQNLMNSFNYNNNITGELIAQIKEHVDMLHKIV